jgi:hypothetical protein
LKRVYREILTPSQATIRSDAVVVGVVKLVEDEAISSPHIGRGRPAQVALIEISETIRGAKGLTHLRVAFGDLADFSIGFCGLVPGQKGVFYVTETAEGDLFMTTTGAPTPTATGAQLEATLAEVRSAALAITDPVKLLTTGETAERCRHLPNVLMAHFAQQKPGGSAKVPVPDAEMKAILDVARLLPWSQPDPKTGNATLGSVFHLFDAGRRGFVAPNGQATAEEAQIRRGGQGVAHNEPACTGSRVRHALIQTRPRPPGALPASGSADAIRRRPARLDAERRT